MTPQSAAPRNPATGYENLNPDRILETIARLRRRIEERFAASGLSSICQELHEVARDARKTADDIARPMWGLRISIYLIILCILLMMFLGFSYAEWQADRPDLAEIITISDALFNDVVLIGAAILFLVTVETRVKRKRALQAVHRLRSIAHIIDMHQLTKDPERVLQHWTWSDTASSPKRTYTPFELGRYLDYCTEMLSLTGKVAALYVEQFPDAQAVGAVNELESLTTSLSGKIWQKIMILNTDQQLTHQPATNPATPQPASTHQEATK